MCNSGLITSIVSSVIMSRAVTSPFFSTLIKIVLGFFVCARKIIFLMFKTISGTSSTTPGILENSCKTPSILIEVMALPSIEEMRILLKELPIVMP